MGTYYKTIEKDIGISICDFCGKEKECVEFFVLPDGAEGICCYNCKNIEQNEGD